jgi:hypothetical protein
LTKYRFGRWLAWAAREFFTGKRRRMLPAHH